MIDKKWRNLAKGIFFTERDASPCTVILSCNQERVSEDRVKAVDIEEDIQGRDVLTFVCPECGQEHKSLRFG